ncbi:hypothetical protein VTJ83DRAFT_1749 [Remersonia thermophila]|uniref:Uncharacterized protein n=1 Tax=Remersonia thermophila TaxID=72144 RepID=A0ABR4DHD7_9PEZI
MVPRTKSTKTSDAASAVTTTTVKKFELPALNLEFGSLTDGTDIPPPLPSPIKEEAVPTPPETPADQQKAKKANGVTNGTAKADATSPASQAASDTSAAGTKRRAEDTPASPTLSSRPGSIRRLFSRGLLHAAYANGDDASSVASPIERPESRAGSTVAGSRKAKRASGWFGRLRGVNDAAPLSPPATDDKKPAGPPPPMIPELSVLNQKLGIEDGISFGNDLFKDIK